MATPLEVIPFNPQPAPGVPAVPTPSIQTSGTGKSPGTGSATSSNPGGAPPPRNYKGAFEIKSFLLRPALTSHFQCWFNPPASVRAVTNYNDDFISISCTEASLPGSSIITNEINDDYTGVTERLGYRRQYDNTVDFTFYVDGLLIDILLRQEHILQNLNQNNLPQLVFLLHQMLGQ